MSTTTKPRYRPRAQTFMLRLCPFCGGKPTVQPWHGGPPTKRVISCENDNCDAAPSVVANTGKLAAELWNYRVPVNDQLVEVELDRS